LNKLLKKKINIDKKYKVELERFFRDWRSTKNPDLIQFYNRYLIAKTFWWTFEEVDKLSYSDVYSIQQALKLEGERAEKDLKNKFKK